MIMIFYSRPPKTKVSDVNLLEGKNELQMRCFAISAKRRFVDKIFRPGNNLIKLFFFISDTPRK
jgi:hypothetical protein